ncbi:bile acid transporter [Bacteroides xylanisolvens]|nr:bile acid transporter [Bacteroides xylanisolvens]
MTMVNTILAPFVTPFLVWLIAGAWVDIDFMSMMMSIVKMVLLPLIIGVGINYFFPRQVKKVNTIMPMFSALVVIITVGCVVSLSGRTILDNGLVILAVVILHNLCGMPPLRSQ